MRSYHFDLGDSNKGCVGLCARVMADSEREAVEALKDAFATSTPHYASVEQDGPYCGTVVLHFRSRAVEYVHVYLNFENLKPSHIDDVEETA